MFVGVGFEFGLQDVLGHDKLLRGDLVGLDQCFHLLFQGVDLLLGLLDPRLHFGARFRHGFVGRIVLRVFGSRLLFRLPFLRLLLFLRRRFLQNFRVIHFL